MNLAAVHNRSRTSRLRTVEHQVEHRVLSADGHAAGHLAGLAVVGLMKRPAL